MRPLALLLAALLLVPAVAAGQTPTATPSDYDCIGDEYYDGTACVLPPEQTETPQPIEATPTAGTQGENGAGETPEPTPAPAVATAAPAAPAAPVAVTAAATLPRTGGSPLLIALIGLSFVLTGTGGRLLIAAREGVGT